MPFIYNITATKPLHPNPTQSPPDLEPSTPQEYVLKGVVHACMGQHLGSKEHLKIAQQLFQLVGASASECDTIPGRQCMASCFYLLRNFEDVNVYLSSIRAYLSQDDDFNWNHGLALAATGDYKAAEVRLARAFTVVAGWWF